MHRLLRSTSRSGNALLTAVIVTALAAAIIATTTNSTLASQHRVAAANQSSNVLAALDVVLARRQRIVIDMAAAGRPEDFVSKTDNYGVDFVGPCEVRWKIEPVWAKSVNNVGTETYVVENPPPDGAQDPPTNGLDNPSLFYLYRIAGEARYSSQVKHDADTPSNDSVRTSVLPGDITSRAQGVRYVSTTNSSVLKYLLYWSLRGPKGDLELSHGPATQLIGHIYSGGSTYLGSSTTCNDWVALRGGSGATTIGPSISSPSWVSGTAYAIGSVVKVGVTYYQAKDAHTSSAANQPGSAGGGWKAYWEDVTACRLESLDGVYRLSKQVMFGAFNGFPMTGVAPAGFSLNGSYLLDAVARPGEKVGNPTTASYMMPDVANYPADVFNATFQGRILNPMRVKDPLATIPVSGSDILRVVNVASSSGLTAVPLRGVDEGTATPVAGQPPANAGNDSRDVTRSTISGYVWATHSLNASAPGFNRQVRTKVNGLAEQPLHSQFVGRPEEPQSLVYYDLDGDPTTDEHEYAMPEFISTSGSTTTDLTQRLVPAPISGIALDCVENPGTYLRESLGGNLYLARRSDYRGWLPVNKDGTAPTSEPQGGMGLVIRERQRPETAYFTPTALPGPADPLYMPFAYGHVRASLWPMTACDVAGEMTDYSNTAVSTWTNGFATTSVAGLTTTNASQSYSSSSSAAVTFRSGTQPGPYWSGGWWDSGAAYQRFFYLARDSWRFIALGRPNPTATNGLNATIWNDNANGTWLLPFAGQPVYNYVDSTINVNWTGIPTGSTGVTADRFAVRWRGFIKPRYTENYTFYVNRSAGHCGVRMWVDDTLIIDSWTESTSEATSQPRALAADQYYPITVEAWDGSGNFGPRVDWQSASQTREILPNARLFTQTMPEGFNPSTFSAVEARLDRITATNGAAGLMLRADNGISQVQDGRNPYIALCYTPTRGVYAQIRGERSINTIGSQTGYFVGDANFDTDSNGSFETPMGDTNGETGLAADNATMQRNATLTPMVFGIGYNSSTNNQRAFTVYTPGTGTVSYTQPSGLPALDTTKYGTSALSGTQWTDTSGSTRTPLNRTPDYPFSVPEGAVDRVWRGPVTLRTTRWPQERSTQDLSAYTRWHLGNTQTAYAASQLFRWLGNTGYTTKAWPSGWPAKDPAVDDLDTSNSVKRLYLFAARTGGATNTGTFSAGNAIFSLGANYGNWYGYETTTIGWVGASQYGDVDCADSTVTEAGGIIYKLLYNSQDSGWVNWWIDTDTNNVPDGATTVWDKTTTVDDAKTVYYCTSPDTRPKVYNGSTFVRYLTQAETLSLMDATYGSGHVAKTSVPAYPTLDSLPSPYTATGDPPPPALSLPTPGLGYTRLAAAAGTSGTTTLTVQSINNGTRLYAAGDVLALHSSLGTEYVLVTAVPSTTTVTVTRGQRGTSIYNHPINAFVTHVEMPLSAIGATAITAGTAGTSATWSVRTLNAATTTIIQGDVLQIGNEQVLVNGAPVAASGFTEPTVPVLRGYNGTPAEAHAINAAIVTPRPVVGLLSTAHTSAITTLTMATTAKLAVDDVIRAGGELMKVQSIVSGTQATVQRGWGYSTPAAQPANTTLYLMTGKTFAVSRGRSVTFENNPWISAGATPSPAWRARAATDPDTDDGGGTRANDWGWYWSGVKNYAPWMSYWSSIAPVGTTGGIASRAFDKTWTGASGSGPLVGGNPTVNVPLTNTNATCPSTDIAATTGSRFADDQPITWTTATAYNIGDLVWYGNKLFRAYVSHTSASSTMPGSGASWTTCWETSYVWLRIERVAATSHVRMLYSIGTSRPTTPAQWRPLLVTPDTASAAAPRPGRPDGDDADPRELEVDLAPWFKQGRATVASTLAAGATALTITAPTTGSFAIGDVIRIGSELCLVNGGSGTSLSVYRNWGGTQTTAVSWAAGTEVTQARWRGDDLLVGLCGQSGSSGTLMDVDASNLRIEQQAPATNLVIDATDWDSASPYGAEDATRYLCSQYQVFWGPYDITEDFFYYGQDGTTPRIASEEWIYNPRYFWSQSRWWYPSNLYTTGGSPVLNEAEKDPAYIIPNSASTLSMRELLAKTNILSINMRALQDYLTTRTLSTAIASRIAGVGPTQSILGSGSDYTLRDHVRTEGLLVHTSRTNRYPWNPSINGRNPWNPNLPNDFTGGSLTTAALAALPNVAPSYDRATQFQALQNLINWKNTAVSITSATFNDLMPFGLGSSSVAGQLWRAPAIKPQDFHHAVRITDASSIDWSYGTSTDFETGGLSFFTPNQLYIKGDVNTTAHSVSFAGTPATKANKLGIYCDTAILLSSAWSDAPMRTPGLVMNTTSGSRTLLSGSGSLAVNQGAGLTLPLAVDSRFQFALLTHTIPTTRQSARLGEASSFVSSLQFMEDWATKNMTFVGSIVAMDTRRYSNAYLLESPKYNGLSPFGWMTAGGNPLTATAWVTEYSAANSWPMANATTYSVNNNGSTITMDNTWSRGYPYIQSIYGAPNRNLYYNPDFSYKPGQPPLMPFGTSAAGMGGWSRIIR